MSYGDGLTSPSRIEQNSTSRQLSDYGEIGESSPLTIAIQKIFTTMENVCHEDHNKEISLLKGQKERIEDEEGH